MRQKAICVEEEGVDLGETTLLGYRIDYPEYFEYCEQLVPACEHADWRF